MYLTSVLIARGLGVEENGVFVGLFSVCQLLLVLSSLGLETTLNKHIPQLDSSSKEGSLRFLIRRSLGVRLVFVISVGVALLGMVFLHPSLFPVALPRYIWLLLAYAGVRSVVNLFIAILTAQLLTRATSVINVGTRVLEVMLMGFLTSTEMSTRSVFLALLFSALMQLAVYVYMTRNALIGSEVKRAMVPMLLFGGIYWTNTVAEYFLGRQGDVLFLSLLLPDASQASLYDVAFAVSQLASLAMTVGLGGVTLAISAQLALQESGALERFYGFLVRVLSLLTIPLHAFLLFNAESVLSVLYSSRYSGAAGIVQGIAAFRIAGRLFGGPENAEFLLSSDRVSRLAIIGIIGAVANVVLDVFLIPRIGVWGAVAGSGIANLTVNILGATAVIKISSVRIQGVFWSKLVAVCVGASFVCSLFMTSHSALTVVLQACSYAGLLILLFVLVKPLTSLDGEWLSKVDHRLYSTLDWFIRKPVMSNR